MAKWTSADMPEMNGMTVVVTGGSSGIGFVAAREMAAAGAHVTLGVRNVAKGRLAAKEMRGSIDVRELDVSDLSSIRAFVDAWTGPLDILVNNAGVMDIPLRRTSDGLDTQTATNSFGPFLLTNLLLPKISDRIVWVTSQLHRMGHLHADDLNWESRPYKSMDAYNDSKLQVVLFSLELQRRLEAASSTVRSVLAHPGIATTSLAAHSGANNINRFSFLLNDPAHGALPTLFAATQNVFGNAYIGPNGLGSIKGYPKVRKPGKAGLDSQSAAQLWTAVSQRVGVRA